MNGAAAHLVMELEEKLVELEGLQGERSQSSSRSGGHVESERINSNRRFETGNQHLTCFTGTVSRYQHTHTVSLINSWFVYHSAGDRSRTHHGCPVLLCRTG